MTKTHRLKNVVISPTNLFRINDFFSEIEPWLLAFDVFDILTQLIKFYAFFGHLVKMADI